jgi:hypothetical protein
MDITPKYIKKYVQHYFPNENNVWDFVFKIVQRFGSNMEDIKKNMFLVYGNNLFITPNASGWMNMGNC